MSRRFDPQLVNGPFGDPGLYIDLLFERRALLFDIGDLAPLSARKLLRVSDVFVSHRHVDHFIGFDQLLRCLYGREKTVRIYGGPGMIEAVEHKLKAYSWNLIGGRDENPVFRVAELNETGQLMMACFRGRTRFEHEDQAACSCEPGVLLREAGFEVKCAFLDHGIPTLAFALKERAHINIWPSKLEAVGLKVGPWLSNFKAAILRGDPEHTPIAVEWADASRQGTPTMPLGQLRQQIMRTTAGRRIAYVVDAAFTPANRDKIVGLAKDADVLFIEATFLDADRAIAAKRGHLTARQAGTLARQAGARRMVTLHYSPRYQDRGAELAQEAALAFALG
jgi:ribonuclease Z